MKFGVYSDIVAEKENVDLQFEAEWRESPEAQTEKRYKKEGNRFRTAFILTDHFFNQKSRDGEYTSNPYTFFAEGRYIPKEGSSISSWINFNPRTRLEFFEDEFSFIYRQFTGGARVKLPILYNTNLYITLKAEEGLRKREALSEGFTTARDMRRYNEIFEAEITQDLNHEFQVWGGARYFRLLEKDRISSALKQEGELLRREPIIYSGILWKIEENIFFWPGIFISFLDNKNTSTVDAQEEKTSDTIGKIDLPIEYQLSNHEAKFVFNPTFQFPRDFFGGFNVQVQFLL